MGTQRTRPHTRREAAERTRGNARQGPLQGCRVRKIWEEKDRASTAEGGLGGGPEAGPRQGEKRGGPMGK